MRGFLIGLFLLFVVVVSVLSVRPGGLRNQLRNVVRRLKLALVLCGIYLAISTAVRLALPTGDLGEIVMIALGGVLAVTFLVLGQDRQLDQR